jgi:DNA polymerase elongation subunit (family B)
MDCSSFIVNLHCKYNHFRAGIELREVLEIGRGFILILPICCANPMELVFKRHITREADEYINNIINSVVINMVEETGIHLSAGESIEFIILDQSDKKSLKKLSL